MVEEHRNSTREPLDGSVQVRLRQDLVCGPGQNLSQDGVYLVANDEIPVEVVLPGESEARKGFLVRVHALRKGEIGIAIRFA
ncbi:MAG: hypothetical protein R3F30_09370 [Planctomycetota bacterium]